MTSTRKRQIHDLLKGIETGDPAAVEVVNETKYIQHNPYLSDDLSGLRSALSSGGPGGSRAVDYQRSHRVLAEGDFVLTVNEGFRSGVHGSFYDLFRVANGKVVEHWDTTAEVPPRSEWKNDNGKF